MTGVQLPIFPWAIRCFFHLIYRWFGVSWLSGVVANVVLNVLTVGLVYAAAFRQFGRVVACA
ncbi:hypothetical protein GCM10025857_10970 [Alicyclobacillus contaminans]|nr:hypothetical protein GCM10025857_10970 [Alicyclobacillus contaminans]